MLCARQSVGQPEECETENMNPEDIYNSIKKTSADIQNLSLGSKLDGYEDIKKKRDFASQDSGIQELRTDSPDGVEHRRGNLHQAYNPQLYQEEVGIGLWGVGEGGVVWVPGWWGRGVDGYGLCASERDRDTVTMISFVFV